MEKRGGEDGRENYTSISVDALATSFKNQMEELPEILPECCIYRVPPTNRALKAEVYAPQVVSIGPFHHNKKELQGMEEHKLRYMKSKLLRKVKEYLNIGHEIKHFVDLLRICHLPSALMIASENSAELISIPNAVQLQEAGVQLLKLGSSDSLLDIKFTKGVLEIPLLVVHDYFKLVMCNILVLESCHYFIDSYIGHYVFFMQMLVDIDKDADFLIHNGIIEDWMGRSSTVAALFNKVRGEASIFIPSYYLYDISKSLNAYCNVPRHKWKATFKRDYCNMPWMVASTTAVVILLILTLLSTISSFLAF
ncbi:hypothetical protein LguiA_033026 [Lonicera macranthoides]